MNQEKHIIEQCLKGNRDAQKQLYETYAGWLLGVCLRYVGQQSTAEDLLHDGFIRILTSLHQFQWQGEGSLKLWMFRIQQNVILQHIRTKDMILSSDDNPHLVEDIAEPETVDTVPRRVLLQLIGELPIGYRTIFNLYVIDGLSHREIAKALGIKENSSASQLLRARRMLAMKIKAWRKDNL